MTELRGAVIGCGFFSANHLNAWRQVEGARIVALCDQDPLRVGTAGRTFGIDVLYDDAERLLAEQKLDFVDIVTTPPSHRALVELAARFRTPMICQKPFATSMDDAHAMVAAADAAGVSLMVHENFRWQSPIIEVKRLLDSGRIGRPFWARVSYRSGYDIFGGQPYLAESERFIIEDLGIHILDLARFLLGEIEQLTARTQRINSRIRGEDVATVLLRHVGGAVSVADFSYASRLAVEPFPETMIEIDGSKGSIRLGQHYRLVVTDPDGSEERDVSPPLLSWAQRPWQAVQESVLLIQRHWIACLKGKREPDTSGRDNLRTLNLVETAYESAAGGVTIGVPEQG